MKRGRPKHPLFSLKEEDEQLRSIANSRALPHGLVRRACIVLMAADGVPNRTIAEEVSLSAQMVSKWRRRYLQQGYRDYTMSFVRKTPVDLR